VYAFSKSTAVEAKLFLREPLTVAFTLALPLLFLFVMGGVFGNKADPQYYRGAGALDYYVPAYCGLVTAIPYRVAGPAGDDERDGKLADPRCLHHLGSGRPARTEIEVWRGPRPAGRRVTPVRRAGVPGGEDRDSGSQRGTRGRSRREDHPRGPAPAPQHPPIIGS
jgi:ABC-2 type transport system permease protein